MNRFSFLPAIAAIIFVASCSHHTYSSVENSGPESRASTNISSEPLEIEVKSVQRASNNPDNLNVKGNEHVEIKWTDTTGRSRHNFKGLEK